MSAGLGTVSEYPVDFKVLNYAPIGFQFSVVNEGTLLFEKDRANRLNFVEDVGLKYMDYFEFSKSYLREIMECMEGKSQAPIRKRTTPKILRNSLTS